MLAARTLTRLALPRAAAALAVPASRRTLHASRAAMDDAEKETVTLNFSLPTGAVYKRKEVAAVYVPSAEGEVGIAAGHAPLVAQLVPGSVRISHKDVDDADMETYFVSGGFALVHPDSVLDLSVVEAVKLQDLDPDAVLRGLQEYTRAVEAAPEDSLEQAHAQIGLDTYSAMAAALGVGGEAE